VPQVVCFLSETVVGLDPKTGDVYWRYPFTNPQQINVASPIVLGNYVFISSGYGRGSLLLEVVASDGRPEARRVYDNNLMRNQFSTSVAAGDHVYGFDEAFLVCMPLSAGGKRLWKERKFKRGSLILAGKDLIVLGEEGDLALVAASPEGYREKALFHFSEERCWTAPVLSRGRLYVRDESKLICYDLRKK